MNVEGSMFLAVLLLEVVLGQQLGPSAMDVVAEVGDPLSDDTVPELGGFDAADGLTELIQHAEVLTLGMLNRIGEDSDEILGGATRILLGEYLGVLQEFLRNLQQFRLPQIQV